MTTRAATLPCDAVIFDLEDAVPLPEKETARILVSGFVKMVKQRGIAAFVRVNSLATGLTKMDLESTVVEGLDGIVLAKTETGSDVAQLERDLTEVEQNSKLSPRSVKVVPLIESAKGVMNALQIASTSDRVIALAFGAGDYYRDLGRDVLQLSRDEMELLFARSQIVNACRAAGIQAIDTPFLGLLTDKEGLAREIKQSVQLGFRGKKCIHPSQIEPINVAFSPSQEDVNRAGRIVKAFEEAQERGLGATSLDGRMIDYMSFQQARDLLATSKGIEERKRASSDETYVSMHEVFS
jgi:citrate lyase subunit beta/citryl-CoA lyase